MARTKMTGEEVYLVGVQITGFLAFLVAWIYAAFTYGLFLGVGLGWIPALVVGLVAGVLWPVLALLVGFAALFILANH